MNKENVLRELKGYIVENDLTSVETVRFLKDIEIDVLQHFVDGKDGFFVLKRTGRIEPFDRNKFYYSIANASDDARSAMTQSAIDGVMRSVKSDVEQTGRTLIRPIELRTFTLNALYEMGYADVREVYSRETESK